VNDEPAMVLFPAIPGSGAGAYIIALSAAWRYADSYTGQPTPYLLQQTIPIARQLGMFITADTLRRIADIIVDTLPDLIAMPPEPADIETARKADAARQCGHAGDLVVTVDGETVVEAEV
jgi:hypothetical protein